MPQEVIVCPLCVNKEMYYLQRRQRATQTKCLNNNIWIIIIVSRQRQGLYGIPILQM